jgi:hypothetical protein
VTISAADKIYSYAGQYKIYLHELEHTELEDFSIALSKFKKLLNDDYWHHIINPLYYYGLRAVSTPVPFDYPRGHTDELLNKVLKYSEDCEVIYPQHALELEDLINLFLKIAASDFNPCYDLIFQLCTEHKWEKIALTVRWSRDRRDIQNFLASDPRLKKIELVIVRDLRKIEFYDAIILLGPMRWFPEYVYRSPRAPEIHSIKYSWIKDDWDIRPVFITNTITYKDKVISASKRVAKEKFIKADDLLPEVDWSYLAERGMGRLKTMDKYTYDTLEEVDAHLVLLEDSNAVFIDTDNDNLLVIDPYTWEPDKGKLLEKTSVSELREGSFLLLRTGGGEFHYLRKMAKGFMKKEAEELEKTQKHWKVCLRRVVENNGIHESYRILRDFGANNPSVKNIRTWLSNKNIKPQRYGDFQAIMRFIGMEDLTDEYWKNARTIDSAHRSAGQRVRKLLLSKVTEVDIDDLEEVGIKEFYLEDEEAGSFTAFRVHHISPESYSINFYDIGIPFESEDTMWAL